MSDCLRWCCSRDRESGETGRLVLFTSEEVIWEVFSKQPPIGTWMTKTFRDGFPSPAILPPPPPREVPSQGQLREEGVVGAPTRLGLPEYWSIPEP